MDDTRPMRGAQGLEHLPRDPEAALHGQRTPEPLSQGLAVNQLHHQVVGADVVHRADIGMIQRGDGAHFAVESFAEALRGHFDRDVTTQPGIERLVDLTHTARAQEAMDLVRPEL